MRAENQSRFLLVGLIVIAFGLVWINSSRAAPLDLKTVEVAYLFNKGNGNRCQGTFLVTVEMATLLGQSTSKESLETG